jgi:hypothetical protein
MEKRQQRSLWKNANSAAYGKTPTAQPMEKRQQRSLFRVLVFCSHVSFGVIP